MGVRGDGEPVEVRDPAAVPPAVGEALPPLRRVNVSGDIGDLLDHRPFFRTRLRGYDRLQVDNYATWVEAELGAARRQNSHLLARYGECAAELARLRRARTRPQRSPEPIPLTDRLGEMLRLAAEEAAGITAAGIDEAERIVTEARAEAEERLRKVELLRQAAVAAGEEVRRERSEVSRLLARARAQAVRAVEVQAEVDDLRRQRDQARESLRRLTARVGEPPRVAESAASVGSEAPLPSGPPAEVAVPPDRREPLATSIS
jgi:cell division septum initiation protein DivIVA